MAKQDINIGAAPNDGTGDTLRNAFSKAISNFNELYAAIVTFVTTATYTAGLALKADAAATTAALALKADATALAAKADLASPALTGDPTAPTQAPGNNSTRLATTAFAEAMRVILAAATALKADAAATTAALALKADASAVAASLALKANSLDVWRKVGGSAVAIVHTGTTAETYLATVTVPAGSLGPNGRVRITALTSASANNANAKTFRIRFGGAAFQLWSLANALSAEIVRIVRNRNATNSQVSATAGLGAYGSSTVAVATMAIDTAAAFDIAFTIILANAGDTVTLEEYCVEVLYGA